MLAGAGLPSESAQQTGAYSYGALASAMLGAEYHGLAAPMMSFFNPFRTDLLLTQVRFKPSVQLPYTMVWG